MAAIIKATVRAFRFFDEYGDPRVERFFLMGSPWPILGIVGFYLYFVNSLGPQMMRDRKPYKLDRVLMAYNVIQILLCLYLTERSVSLAWGPGSKFRWVCEPVDYTINPHSQSIITSVWLYVMIKLIDLLDTVFFVLRKKSSQVTFLHVYHHAGMVLGSWFTCKFLAGGHGTFLGCINSFVHIVMYTYYLITSVWQEYKQNVWWKKYITQLQMVQFLMIAVHSLAVLFVKDCQFPRMYCILLFVQNFFMLILFYDFYRKAYLNKKTS